MNVFKLPQKSDHRKTFFFSVTGAHRLRFQAVGDRRLFNYIIEQIQIAMAGCRPVVKIR